MLSRNQYEEAIRQMIAHCDVLMPDYKMVSARSALYQLGYNQEDADQVIRVIAYRGFDYCLDPIVACAPWGEPKEHPAAEVCYWGPDQLKSRLHGVTR